MLLADAVRSETYRLLKNRMTVFWSLLFVPLLFVVGGAFYHVMSKAKGDEAAAAAKLPPTMGSEALNLADSLAMGAGAAANGALLVFMLIAAATVYAGDYRWETWRLISARNSRSNLLLGKVGTMKLAALAATVVFLIAALIFGVTQAVVYGRPISFSMGMSALGDNLLIWLLAYIRIVQYGLVALLTAVVTRSLMAALFVPIALGFGQSLFQQFMPLLGWSPDMWAAQLLLPGLAFDTLKAHVVENPMMPTGAGMLMKSALGLALWCVVPLGAALAWFQRQDLSKE